MIVLHNFMHLFPTPKQLEFKFSDERFPNFINSIFEPENIIQATLSYFGHIGVQIFIFLSAYGLTKSWIANKPKYWRYIQKRFLTIYPSFLLAICVYTIVTTQLEYGILGPLKILYWNIYSILLKISLISYFIPNESLSIVGP